MFAYGNHYYNITIQRAVQIKHIQTIHLRKKNITDLSRRPKGLFIIHITLCGNTNTPRINPIKPAVTTDHFVSHDYKMIKTW